MQVPLWMTLATRRVLWVLLSEPFGQHYGVDIARRAGLPLGGIYPVLARLQRAGWVASGQQAVESEPASRHPRRYYQLTGTGAQLARRRLQTHRDRGSARLGRITLPLPWPNRF